jgi:stage V sporulation protein G
MFNQVRINIVEKDSLRAMATVKVLDAMYLTGIRVIEGKNGLFISMPSKKSPAGEYQDIYFPASKAMRDELQALILSAYKQEVALNAVAA